ncbi:MAG: DUF169 domain-containing protein [Anaerolineales bacterium]|jgi:uncharacterized protein (DUF169 family)
MDTAFSDFFITRWQKYFPGADLPICYFYTDQVQEEDLKQTVNIDRCLIGNLPRVQDGYSFVYHADTLGCSGGKRYSGFSTELRPNFEYFLSCGIPGELEGERYKKSPQLVKEYLKSHPPFKAPGKYLVFKRLDKLAEEERPFAVIFFATPDVLSGLFALANYDRADPYGVITPMGSGCASIIGYPFEEAQSESPRCILGMFDVSARPCVPEGKITFTVPMQRLEQMVHNMDESFLITKSWDLVKKRL